MPKKSPTEVTRYYSHAFDQYHPALRGYLHRLDPDVDPTCPKCRLADQTLEHWLLDCPGTSAMKLELFGTHVGDLGWLSSHPLKTVALDKMTLLE